ncbi:unnamed protein product [Withania somnifera]
MMSRSPNLLSRNGSFRPENLGQNALATIGNLCFTIFVVGVLIFTIIAATYEPEDPLFQPSKKITNFLTSKSNATFKADDTVMKTGEDFIGANQTAFSTFINLTDVDVSLPANDVDTESNPDCHGKTDEPIDCTNPDVFHLLMRAAIEKFKDIHFYRFGKSVRGSNDSSCHMAWRFRPKDGKAAAFYKDYREFVVSRSENCTLSVVSIGDYHTGGNARKRKRENKDRSSGKLDEGFEKAAKIGGQNIALPEVGEAVNDSLPMVESESSFTRGKYLVYHGGGDRCKSMNHYLWSFMCALGEAQYLNRTLIMDLSICLSKIYTSSGHLKDSASVLDQKQFWSDWENWHQKNGLTLHLVEDFRVPPIKLSGLKDTLIMRKFGNVEPDNYWYRVCEGETESVVQRPWHLVWKSRRLMDIVSAIASRLNWDYDSVHVVRGEKARNREMWPHLAQDTSPDAILSSLQDKIDDGRNLYIVTNEPETSFFNPLKDKYSTHFLSDYKDLWDENSEWYSETTKLHNGSPFEFDGYMRVSVDTEVFLRGKKQIETFNDLTQDCKDGINTCTSSS